MPKSGASIKGVEALQRKLRNLGSRSTANKIQRRAVNLACTSIVDATRSHVHSDEGDLRRAITKKVEGKGSAMNGIVGADANYVGQEGHKLTADQAHAAGLSGDDLKRPAKYDHLVEYGHGPNTPPHPFLRPGWDESIGAAQETFARQLAAGIEQEASR